MPVTERKYGKPIPTDLIDAFEKEFGITLPQALKQIARDHDGSVPHPDRLAFADPRRSTGYDIVGIGQLYRFVGRPGSGWSISEANRTYADDFPGLVFFSEAANGWGFALDYRNEPNDPPVVVVRFDVDDGDMVVPVARTFDAML